VYPVFGEARTPDSTHIFAPRVINVTLPCKKSAVAPLPARTRNIDVEVETLDDADVKVEYDTYPVDSNPDTVPSCIEVNAPPAPFVLTPLNITVIRFAQLGILVKSTAVPVAVCAVANVSEPPAVSDPVTLPVRFPVIPEVVSVAAVEPLTLIYPCARELSFSSVSDVAIIRKRC
jgi:hypothetical protein